MRLEARRGARGVLVDLDTGRPIRWCRWADLGTGEFEAYKIDPAYAKRLKVSLGAITYRGRARLRWLPAVPSLPPVQAAPAPITPRGTPVVMVPGRECEVKGCHRLASWRTVDEREVEPEPLPGGGVAEAAVAVRGHLFCDRHYRYPVFTSLRGVESEVIVTARPQ